MKKVLYILATILVGFTSCTKETTSTTNSNSLASPFTLKYEIVTSSAIDTSKAGNGAYGKPLMVYSNGTQQPEIEFLTPTTSWSKTVTVTTTNRPFVAMLHTHSDYISTAQTGLGYFPIILKAQGTIMGKIYVNGNLVASVTNPTTLINTTGTSNAGAGIYMSYPIQ
jgi:hypothetical protein